MIQVRRSRKGPIEVSVRAEIGFLNDKHPSKWHEKVIYVNFLAETSDGNLIDFRRMP